MRKKARSTGAAAKEVAGNTDLLWEILLRVPLKSLVRLKCVSKQWQTLISDQQFCDSHSLHHQQHQRFPNSLIFSNKNDPPHILSFTTTTTTPTPHVLNLNFLNQSNVIVIRSCNGLLLCRGHNNTYFICNPITRDFTTLNLARHPCTRDKDKTIHLYLAFDPSISPRYKVVSVAASLDLPLDWVFHVYTFKTRSRIGPEVSVTTLFAVDAGDGVYYNGAIHWCSKGQFSVYFDIDTQRLKIYPMPSSSVSKNPVIEYFGESGGRLAVIKQTSNVYVYDIFELKQDYSGWSLRHRVDFNPLKSEFPQIWWIWHHLAFQIVCTAKDKKSSMLVLILGKGAAIMYDPVDKTSRKLCDFSVEKASIPVWNSLAYRGGTFAMCRGVLQHFENLVQPKDANCFN